MCSSIIQVPPSPPGPFHHFLLKERLHSIYFYRPRTIPLLALNVQYILLFALKFWLITHNYKNHLATSDYFGLSSPYNRKHGVLQNYFSATLFPCYKYILLKLNTPTSPILHNLFSLACMIRTLGNSSTD